MEHPDDVCVGCGVAVSPCRGLVPVCGKCRKPPRRERKAGALYVHTVVITARVCSLDGNEDGIDRTAAENAIRRRLCDVPGSRCLKIEDVEWGPAELSPDSGEFARIRQRLLEVHARDAHAYDEMRDERMMEGV